MWQHDKTEILDHEKIDCETRLKNQLIEKIMYVTAFTGLIAFIIAQIRMLHLGWHHRDLLQAVATGLILFLAFSRTLNIQHKVPFLIAALTLAAIGGIGTLGMLSGMVFIFPISVVIMAIFYPPKATIIFILCALLFYGAIAFGFCSGALELPEKPLMTNPRHWGVYIACAVFFFLIATVAIYNYRKITRQLIHQISDQRDDLNEAFKHVKTLSGLLPICASCKKIRDDSGYWDQLENYILNHSDAKFSHAICPICMKKLYPEFADDVNEQVEKELHRKDDSSE